MFFQHRSKTDFRNLYYQRQRVDSLRILSISQTKKRFFNLVLVLFVISSLAGGMYFNSQKAQGVDFTFIQTDWSGGVTDIVATHTDNQTGWIDFNQKDPGVSTAATGISLDPQAIGKMFSSSADFSSGTNSDTNVVGLDDAAVVELLGNQVTQIASGGYHTCALKNDGTVFCWGSNSYGQLGDNSTTQRLVPVQVVGAGGVGMLSGVRQIVASQTHTCALKTDDSVFCWGSNSYGQLGDNTITQKNTPVQVLGVDGVGTLADISQVTVGWSHTCALKSDNSVFCWGNNANGQLGDNTITQKNTPVQVLGVGGAGTLADVKYVEAGYMHTCVVKNDNSAFCWGNNENGQLGDNTIIQKNTPVQVLGVGAVGILADVDQIKGGGLYTCALKVDGSVFCWGYNNRGQLGDNTLVQKLTPIQVVGVGASGTLSDVGQIETGYAHTCAIKNDNSVFCWGYGSFGQLGNNVLANKLIPTQVLGVAAEGYLSSIEQVEGGYVHTCALGTDGTVFCWGYNGMGQLGDNTITQRAVPIQTLNLVTYLSPGTHTSAATDLSETKDFTTLSFNKTVPANTTLTIDVRAGNTTDPDDGSWTAWQNDVADGGNISTLNGNRYIQYRANLATTDITTTPSLSDITFHFTTRQTLTSSAYDTEVDATTLASLQWSENLLPNTDIQFQLRTSADGLTWGPWCGPDDPDADPQTCATDTYFTDSGNEAIDEMQKDHLSDRYFQYQAILSSTDGLNTPTLASVTASYATINAPTVTTSADPTVASFSATASGNVTATGGENPARYIQYGTTSGTYPNQCSANTGSTGTYSCDITNLAPETTYYYRAKAVNSAGEAVGAELSFRTLPESVIIPEPDSIKISDATASSYFEVDGALDAANQATTNLNITLTTDIGQAYLPLNTIITNTDGGTFDLSQLDITNVTASVRSTVPTSRGAIEIGVPDTRLTFTNNPITISIAVDPVYNGDSLAIQSKSAGSSIWVDEGSCVVTNGACTFTTTHATTYSVNGDGSLQGETDINTSLPIEATIAITCTDSINMNPITGTGRSTVDASNEATCTIKTNNSNGYKLEWSTASTEMTNANSDTISGYLPTIPNTPEAWNLDQATSAWGARLKSTSTDSDTDLWGTTDGYTGNWLNIPTSAYQLVSRTTETLQTGSDEIIQFGSEIGSNKFQPTGTYATSVVLTATTL